MLTFSFLKKSEYSQVELDKRCPLWLNETRINILRQYEQIQNKEYSDFQPIKKIRLKLPLFYTDAVHRVDYVMERFLGLVYFHDLVVTF